MNDHPNFLKWSHGGSLAIGKRKKWRPFKRKQALHLVMKSRFDHVTFSMLTKKHEAEIARTLRRHSKKFDIRILNFANVGNHLHILIRWKRKIQVQNFLRAFAGVVARIVTGAQRGRPFGKFWGYLAFSKVVWDKVGRQVVIKYIDKNKRQARDRRSRVSFLDLFLRKHRFKIPIKDQKEILMAEMFFK